MGRYEAYAEQKRREAQKVEQEGLWPELCRRIHLGEVIPIISNALYNDLIFDIDRDQIIGASAGEENPGGWSIEEQLARIWATAIDYPFHDGHWLPRVALYNRVVKSNGDLSAKMGHLKFLKEFLLYLAKEAGDADEDTIKDMQDDLENLSFSQVAAELGYPKADQEHTDPLKLLAMLKLPIYITTSYFDFLERAILANGRTPRTQVCFWSGQPAKFVNETHQTAQDLKPSEEQPVVYHIYGLEAYPQSMVLSEDDYLDFLARISQDTRQKNPILPLYLRKALTQSSLLLLGYRLRDWDFRTLFRGIINTMPNSLRDFNLAIQLDPRVQRGIISTDQVRVYLEEYFGSSKFTVEWGTSHDFIETLWKKWQQWQR